MFLLKHASWTFMKKILFFLPLCLISNWDPQNCTISTHAANFYLALKKVLEHEIFFKNMRCIHKKWLYVHPYNFNMNVFCGHTHWPKLVYLIRSDTRLEEINGQETSVRKRSIRNWSTHIFKIFDTKIWPQNWGGRCLFGGFRLGWFLSSISSSTKPNVVIIHFDNVCRLYHQKEKCNV